MWFGSKILHLLLFGKINFVSQGRAEIWSGSKILSPIYLVWCHCWESVSCAEKKRCHLQMIDNWHKIDTRFFFFFFFSFFFFFFFFFPIRTFDFGRSSRSDQHWEGNIFFAVNCSTRYNDCIVIYKCFYQYAFRCFCAVQREQLYYDDDSISPHAQACVT